MFNRAYIASAFLAALTLVLAAPAAAIDGEVLITNAKANAGNVTPGDAAGYPVTISKPGRFKLASNLFVAANKIGIQVTSPYVTIDLNGFLMQGSDVAWYGIAGGVDAVTIKNGTIAKFQFDGINGGSGRYWIVDSVRSIENGRDGMRLGEFAVVRSSVAVENNFRGIFASASSVIQGNTASNNSVYGIHTTLSTVVGNAINSNGSFGVFGGGNSVGASGNTLGSNNAGGDQTTGLLPQHPNACIGGGCP